MKFKTVFCAGYDTDTTMLPAVTINVANSNGFVIYYHLVKYTRCESTCSAGYS